MTRVIGVLALLLITALAPAGVAGQEIRGVLRSGAGDSVGGVMVMLLGDGGRTVHAGLTNDAGDFTLRAPRAGTYHVRAEGIGYATVTHGPFDVGADGIPGLELSIEVQPIALPALDVSGASQCRVRPGDGVAAHTLWDEAAKALRSAALLQEHELIEYSVATYEREVSLVRGREHTERHPPQLVRGRPFGTRSPAELAEEGYVQMLDDEVLYHGPDAHVLLSEDFLDTHCVRVEWRGADRAGLIGLAFEPVAGRRVADIAGVLWVDNSTGELQYLTWEYTGLLPGVAPAGGRIEFERLAGGGWIVQRWWIRMQRVALDRGRNTGNTGRRVTQGYLEMGGEVSDVRRTGPG